jgi:hypothetical protein
MNMFDRFWVVLCPHTIHGGLRVPYAYRCQTRKLARGVASWLDVGPFTPILLRRRQKGDLGPTVWVLLDLDNGDIYTEKYLWYFRTKKEATNYLRMHLQNIVVVGPLPYVGNLPKGAWSCL